MLLALTACGGGGDPAADSASQAPALSAAVAPNTSAADGPVSVQSAYQPGVRVLAQDSAGPQLLEAAADGTLRFSAAPGAQVGEVLLVDGRAYKVLAVDTAGTVLQTRAPLLGEVFSRLRVQGSLTSDDLAAAQGGHWTAGIKRALGAVLPQAVLDNTFGFSKDLSAGPVVASLAGRLAVKLSFDIDYTVDAGLRRFEFKLEGDLTESIQLAANRRADNAGKPVGIQLLHIDFLVPNTAGTLRLDIPIMLQPEASGSLKLNMPLLDGRTGFMVQARLDPVTGALVSSGSLGSDARAGTPTIEVDPAANVTPSLAVGFKIGPDVRLRLLGTMLPLEASLRVGAGVSATTATDGSQVCVGWAGELTGEAGVKLTLGGGLDRSSTAAMAPWSLGKDDSDLERCKTPVAPAPAPGPAPAPAPAPVPATDLLPLPTGLSPLPGYTVRLGRDLWIGAVSPMHQTTEWLYAETDANGHVSASYTGQVHTLEPELVDALTGRPVLGTDRDAFFQRFDWRGECRVRAYSRQWELLVAALPEWAKYWPNGQMSGTFQWFGRNPLAQAGYPAGDHALAEGLAYVQGPASVPGTMEVVCQAELTEPPTGRRWYLRSEPFSLPAGFLDGGSRWPGATMTTLR